MQTFSTPRGDARVATLELIRGKKHLRVRAGEIGELCRAMFAGIQPRAVADDGRVTIAYPRFSIAGLFRHHRAEIELNPALPWTLTLLGGVGESSIDLRGLALSGFEVTGGASNVRLLLPAPRGHVRVRIGGGASVLTLLRPAGTAAVLRVGGGASRLTFDAERYGAIGGTTTLASHGGSGERARYEIDVLGGAADLTIAEAD